MNQQNESDRDELDFYEWLEENPLDPSKPQEHFQTEEEYEIAYEKYRDKREFEIWSASKEHARQESQKEIEELKEDLKFLLKAMKDNTGIDFKDTRTKWNL